MKDEWLSRIKQTTRTGEDFILHMEITLDGETISHVGIREREISIYGCQTKVGCIGGVATEKKFRERGLATRLLKSSIKQIDEDEGDIMFVSGDRGLYRRQDCVDAIEVCEFTINRQDVENFNASEVKLETEWEREMVKIVETYQKEPIRFLRPLENFQKRLEGSPMPVWAEPDVLILRKGDEFSGYLVVQESGRRKGREPGHGYISEYAGDRKNIADAIPLLFSMYDFNDLRFWVPRYDAQLRRILTKREMMSKRRNMPGHTMRITNLPRLMKRLRFYIEERIGKDKADSIQFVQEEDNFLITLGSEKFECDGKMLVPIMFGTYKKQKQEFIPREGKLAKVFEALFPVPFPWPGLDSF